MTIRRRRTILILISRETLYEQRVININRIEMRYNYRESCVITRRERYK